MGRRGRGALALVWNLASPFSLLDGHKGVKENGAWAISIRPSATGNWSGYLAASNKDFIPEPHRLSYGKLPPDSSILQHIALPRFFFQFSSLLSFLSGNTRAPRAQQGISLFILPR